MNQNKPYNPPNQGPDVARAIVDKIGKLDNLAALKGQELVDYANDLGKFLKERELKTSQIRKFLDAVKRLKYLERNDRGFDFRNEAMMIKPKLAYASGRQENPKKPNPVRPLMDVMNICIDKIRGREDFEKFGQFVEAIVAYHKYYGGNE